MYAAIAAAWFAFILYITWGAPPGGPWITGWHRWDAEWYSQIWHDGYGSDPRTLVFMPMFAWLAGIVGAVTFSSFGFGALILNVVCFTIAGVIASDFLSKRFHVPAWPVFLFHVLSPAAFYAFMPYSDALFYLLFWLMLRLAVRPPETLSRLERATCWLLMAALPSVRTTGFFLGIWVFFRRWYALALIVPFALVLLVNHWFTEDPFFFLHAQARFDMPAGGIWEGIVYHWDHFRKGPFLNPQETLFWIQITVLPILSFLFIFISATWLLVRGERFLAVTLLAIALLSRNQAYWRSVVRYDLPLMPLIVLPWVKWSSAAKTTGRGRGLILSVCAIAVLAMIGIAGLAIQWGVGRILHYNGIWAF